MNRFIEQTVGLSHLKRSFFGSALSSRQMFGTLAVKTSLAHFAEQATAHSRTLAASMVPPIRTSDYAVKALPSLSAGRDLLKVTSGVSALSSRQMFGTLAVKTSLAHFAEQATAHSHPLLQLSGRNLETTDELQWDDVSAPSTMTRNGSWGEWAPEEQLALVIAVWLCITVVYYAIRGWAGGGDVDYLEGLFRDGKAALDSVFGAWAIAVVMNALRRRQD